MLRYRMAPVIPEPGGGEGKARGTVRHSKTKKRHVVLPGLAPGGSFK